MDCSGKVFVITGGASGLGEACGRHFYGLGGKIYLLDLSVERGEQVANELGDRCSFIHADITDEENITKIFNDIWLKENSIDVLINCAGIGTPSKIVDKNGNLHGINLFNKVLQVNAGGTFNTIQAFTQLISKNKERTRDIEQGVIINTASVAAFDGQIGQAAYSASKGAIASMTLPIARELSSIGVRVMTIAPGIFDTPMLAGLPEDARVSLGKQVPFPARLGSPAEYAFLAQHIIENPMLNGEVIRLDGALRMGPK